MRDNHRIREDIEVDELKLRGRDTREEGVDSWTSFLWRIVFLFVKLTPCICDQFYFRSIQRRTIQG
jgi:hypothetical protein